MQVISGVFVVFSSQAEYWVGLLLGGWVSRIRTKLASTSRLWDFIGAQVLLRFGGIGVCVLDDDGVPSGSGSGGTRMASPHGIMPSARALHPALLPADQVLLPSPNLHRPLHPATRHHGPRQVTLLILLNNPSRRRRGV